MKKRLFITSALMTVVLGASLATGTYAWYQVSAGGVSLANNSGTITTGTDTTFEAVELSAEFSQIDKLALTDSNGKSYVYVNGVKNDVTGTTEMPKFDEVKLTLSGSGVDWATIAGNYTVTVTTEAPVRLSLTPESVYAGTTSVTYDVTIDANGLKLTSAEGAGSSSLDLTFYVSVAGAEEVETNVGGSVTASIAAKQ